jgi:uncharacterized protein YqgQ
MGCNDAYEMMKHEMKVLVAQDIIWQEKYYNSGKINKNRVSKYIKNLS